MNSGHEELFLAKAQSTAKNAKKIKIQVADKRLGLLIDFNVAVIKDGIVRIVNGLED